MSRGDFDDALTLRCAYWATQIGLIDKRTLPTDLAAAGGRLTINTLTRGAERREGPEEPQTPQNPPKMKKRGLRLERGQKNPNHIMIWIALELRCPDQPHLNVVFRF